MGLFLVLRDKIKGIKTVYIIYHLLKFLLKKSAVFLHLFMHQFVANFVANSVLGIFEDTLEMRLSPANPLK